MGIYIVIFITLVAAVIVAASQILFKIGLRGKRVGVRNLIPIIFGSRAIILGGIGYFASLSIYLIALGSAPLSVVYPIFASSFIFVTLFSSVFLGERFPIYRSVGIALIFLGIVIVALSY
ncbi:MAG: EamA family transporter [Candidatus Marsarchaeota archaeon]|nr:EamA family transporter [Candidatus Marsarchaeota archaeon]